MILALQQRGGGRPRKFHKNHATSRTAAQSKKGIKNPYKNHQAWREAHLDLRSATKRESASDLLALPPPVAPVDDMALLFRSHSHTPCPRQNAEERAEGRELTTD